MTYSLQISCSKDRLKEIREFVSDVLIRHSYPDVESNKIILAVDEICANLIIHSNNCDPQETLKLQIDYQDRQMMIFEIEDHGHGFNFNSYHEPEINELIKAKKKGGVGLLLVKRIMDEIEFVQKGNKNVCRLIKKLT